MGEVEYQLSYPAEELCTSSRENEATPRLPAGGRGATLSSSGRTRRRIVFQRENEASFSCEARRRLACTIFCILLFGYLQAILEVGEVLQFYDAHRRFPAWGFGARPIDGPVSHCFNLNGSTYQPEVLQQPELAAALIAGQSLSNSKQKYFILLIVTETKDALVKASDLPLSILIVGVGGADFKEMEILDAEKGERIESPTGRVASRDIVQFVAMRDAQSGEVSVIQSLLAELPRQFMSYMQSRDVDQPN
ncbi:hypothetical protein BHE74_00014336 [Ensete ventricosum]|nr:hypothetical protein BHE74_00014336 [Ensete ventricosum]